MNLIYVIDYIYPAIRSGDSRAAISEVLSLKRNGQNVFVISNYAENGDSVKGIKFWIDGIGLVNNYWYIKENIIDAVVVHQISSIESAIELRREYECVLIGRIHVQYDKLLAISRILKCREEDIVSRLSLESTVRKYGDFLQYCDALIGVEVSLTSLYASDKYWYFPPILGLEDMYASRLRKRLMYTTKKKIESIIVGGRLTDPAKGFDRIIELAQLCETNRIRLSIVGNISKYQSGLINKLSCVTLYDWIDGNDEYVELVSKADAFVVTSYYESFGLMTIEALLQGLFVFSCGQGFLKYFKELIPDIYFIDCMLLPSEYARNVIGAIKLINSEFSLNKKKFNNCVDILLGEMIQSYDASRYLDILRKIIISNCHKETLKIL